MSARAASDTVPAVSIMSSTITHGRPSTSPITFSTSATLARGRRLSRIANAASSCRAKPRAIFAAPTSGATTTRSASFFRR
jgi:hypothetical protein